MIRPWRKGLDIVVLLSLLLASAACAAPRTDTGTPGSDAPANGSGGGSGAVPSETAAVDGESPAEGEFALYLTPETFTPARLLPESGALDLTTIPLEATPFLSQDDIVAYDTGDHALRLTPDAASRVAALEVPVSGRAFVVRVGEDPIYAGAFWTPLSSLSFDGIVIMLLPNTRPDDNTVQIELGYPGPGFFHGEDPRHDPRILEALERSDLIP